jgi:hypothetical protein
MSLMALRNASQRPVQTGAPFINVTASPVSGVITQGGTRDFTVSVSREGYLDVVTPDVVSLPSGVTASWPNGQTMPNGVVSRILRLTADAGAPVISSDAFTITASGPGVTSVGTGRTISVVSSSAVEPFYQTSFEEAAVGPNVTTLSVPNVFTWQSGTATRITDTSETTLTPAGYSGAVTDTKGLRFRYVGSVDDAAWSEQRFNFPVDAPRAELWVEWYTFFPTGWVQRNSASSDNNKHFAIWRNRYGLNDNMVVIETEQSGDGTIAPGTLYYGNYNAGSGTSVAMGNMIGPSCPIEPGTWSLNRLHLATATSAGATNGIIKYSAGGTTLANYTNLPLWSFDEPAVAQGWRIGYFMGYHNSGYATDTRIMMDDVKFYDQNPGWTF